MFYLCSNTTVLLVNAIGNERMFRFDPPSPWVTDGSEDTDDLSVKHSKSWFDKHKTKARVRARLGVRGLIPVQSTRAVQVSSDWNIHPVQNCSFMIEDLRASLPNGEVRLRGAVIVCPTGWECRTYSAVSHRVPDKFGRKGIDPRRMARCLSPNARVLEQVIAALTSDCLDSLPAEDDARSITARISRKRKQPLDIDLNLPDVEPELENGSAQNELEALDDQQAESLMPSGVLLTIRDKQHATVNRQVFDFFEISMKAEVGHVYQACLANGNPEELTLTLATSSVANEHVPE